MYFYKIFIKDEQDRESEWSTVYSSTPIIDALDAAAIDTTIIHPLKKNFGVVAKPISFFEYIRDKLDSLWYAVRCDWFNLDHIKEKILISLIKHSHPSASVFYTMCEKYTPTELRNHTEDWCKHIESKKAQ